VLARQSRHRGLRASLVAVASLIALGITAANATASTVLGQSPPLAGSLANCGNVDGAVAQLAVSTGPSYVVPAGGGVITSWRSGGFDGDRDLAFRVYTGNPLGTSFTPVAESPTETFPLGMSPSFPIRIPVSGGEMLGLHIPVGSAVNGCVYVGAGAGNKASLADAVMPVGQTETHTMAFDWRVNVSAVLEADADHDGFGDETQDACPTDSATQGACPAVAQPGPTGQQAVGRKKCKKKHSKKKHSKKKRKKCRKKAK
jgi:hypothetical protein